jgi:integrase
MPVNTRLTDNDIRKALPPGQGQRILWDAELKGFGVRITPAGAKSFILDYRSNQRQRRITLGAYPDWTVAAARKAASDLKRNVDLGADPMGERNNMREAPTMQDLWDRYRQEWLPAKEAKNRQEQTSLWENIILPKLGKCKLSTVEPADIDALHQEMTHMRGTPTRANRMICSVRKAFNLAIRWNWMEKNPATGARRNPEEKRDRYLNKVEIAALAKALNEHSEQNSANAIKLLMLTGARRGEVLGATWAMFDLENGIWTKPSAHTKQRKLHRVPLSGPALHLLKSIKQQAEADFAKQRRENPQAHKSPYVFPSLNGKPLTEIKRTWVSVCRKASLLSQRPKKDRHGKPVKDENGNPVMTDWPNVRIHDLRHSFASILVSAGASLPLIGQMLGHTQVSTTARYAHLYDDPLRKAADLVGQAIPLGMIPQQQEAEK